MMMCQRHYQCCPFTAVMSSSSTLLSKVLYSFSVMNIITTDPLSLYPVFRFKVLDVIIQRVKPFIGTYILRDSADWKGYFPVI